MTAFPGSSRASVTGAGPPPPQPEPAPEPQMDGDPDVGPLVARTLAGLQRHTDGPVLASRLKRAILRKDPTFDEADHGFRSFTELLRHLAGQRVVELADGSSQGDPQVAFPLGRLPGGRRLPPAGRGRHRARVARSSAA